MSGFCNPSDSKQDHLSSENDLHEVSSDSKKYVGLNLSEAVSQSPRISHGEFYDVAEEWNLSNNDYLNDPLTVPVASDHKSDAYFTEKGSRPDVSVSQQFDQFDNSMGLGYNYNSYSDYDDTFNHNFSNYSRSPHYEGYNRSMLNAHTRSRYDIFNDYESSFSRDYLYDDMRPYRSDSRGVSPCVDRVSAYTDDDATTGLYQDQFLDDLYHWVWEVVYKNGGRMELTELTNLLYSSSKEWYNIINTTFGNLQFFLRRYPSDFFLSTNRGIVIVSIASHPRQQGSLQISRSNSGYSAHSRHDSMNSAASETRSLSRKSYSPYRPSTPSQEFDAVADIRYVIDYVISVLSKGAEGQMKAVELANAICHQFGSAVLTSIRETYGGLLNLLEEYPNLFKVLRIPKNDIVLLIRPGQELGQYATYSPIQVPVAVSPHTPPRVGATETSSSRGASRCLHLGNVGVRSTEQDIREEFGPFGNVEDVKIVHQGDRRYAFVYYSNASEAEAAKVTLSRRSKWKGNISYAKKEKDATERRSRVAVPNRHLWIGNIGHDISESNLRKIFGKFGVIENVTVLSDKGCAFVDFADTQAAIRAQQQKGMMIGSNLVELGFGKMDEPPSYDRLFTEKDRMAVQAVVIRVVSSLRFRERLALEELLRRVAESEEFRARQIETVDRVGRVEGGEVMGGVAERSESVSGVQKNLDFLRSVVMEASAVIVVQEDLVMHQVIVSSNSLPGKSQEEKSCIDVLEDLLFSNLNLVCWPRNQRRDSYLMNTIKQLLIRSEGSINLNILAQDIVNLLFYNNKPINNRALREFFKAYSSVLSIDNDIVSLCGM